MRFGAVIDPKYCEGRVGVGATFSSAGQGPTLVPDGPVGPESGKSEIFGGGGATRVFLALFFTGLVPEGVLESLARLPLALTVTDVASSSTCSWWSSKGLALRWYGHPA